MEQTVADFGLMNVARLRVVDFERMVRTVPIGFIREFPVKREDITRKIQRKFGDVFAPPFAAQKFAPRGKQIFHGNDIIENMIRPPFTLSLSLSLSVMPRS